MALPGASLFSSTKITPHQAEARLVDLDTGMCVCVLVASHSTNCRMHEMELHAIRHRSSTMSRDGSDFFQPVGGVLVDLVENYLDTGTRGFLRYITGSVSSHSI